MKRSVNFSRQRKPPTAKQLRRAFDSIGLTDKDRKRIAEKCQQVLQRRMS